MCKIKKIQAREILDSRGNPTVEAEIFLDSGINARSCVPSGASTGEHEAVELRDGDPNRYMGNGVLKAVENVNAIIAPALIGYNIHNQSKIDRAMIEIDGTPNKSNLGANSILAVSIAVLGAAAKSNKKFIFENLNFGKKYIMPRPMMNILNGGSHADNNIDIQEFMIVPVGANTFRSGLQMGVEVFQVLKKILKKKGLTTSVGDEGGFAPNLQSNEEALLLLSEAVEKAGYNLEEINFALDVASSELYDRKNKQYFLKSEGVYLNSSEMISYYKELCSKHPIISIEDGLDQNDWRGWVKMNQLMGDSIQLVGDDLTVTNFQKLQQAIHKKAMNAILIKPNQVGTITETVETIKLAKENKFGVVVSHRSGETEDVTIADLAVGTASGQIKTGSLARTDRVAKYNQLLRIEEQIYHYNK